MPGEWCTNNLHIWTIGWELFGIPTGYDNEPKAISLMNNESLSVTFYHIPQALNPAMVAWRKRLSFITERFEASPKADKPKELPAQTSASNSKISKDSENNEPSSESIPLHQAVQEESDSQEASISAASTKALWGMVIFCGNFILTMLKLLRCVR